VDIYGHLVPGANKAAVEERTTLRQPLWAAASRTLFENATLARKNKPGDRRRKVLIVNGDATYQPGKAQNFLTDEHVQKLADAVRGFADIDKLARVVPAEEIAANGFNLNISRYVQTNGDVEVVDVEAEVAKLQNLIAKRNEAERVMFGHLKRLGYVE